MLAVGILAFLTAQPGARAGPLEISDVESPSPSVAEREERLRQPLVKSPSGRFVLTGPEPAALQAVARWADTTANGLVRVMGHEFNFRNRLVILAVHPGAASEVPPRVAMEQSWMDDRLVQRLALRDVENVDRQEAEEALCFLLLQGDVVLTARVGRPPDAEPQVSLVPRWLVRGLVQNLDPGLRARNTDLLLQRWQSGSLPALSRLIPFGQDPASEVAPPYGPAAEDDLETASAGLFTAWLFSQNQGGDLAEAIIRDLAAGRPATLESVVKHRPSSWSAEDLDARWDAWLLRQKTTVHVLGQPARTAVEQLRTALLLWPGYSGIPPLPGKEGAPLTLAELIEHRKAPWAPDVCRGRAVALRLLAAGRDDRLRKAADAYARFFEGVAQRERPSVLRRRLDHADRARAELERPRPVGTIPETLDRGPTER